MNRSSLLVQYILACLLFASFFGFSAPRLSIGAKKKVDYLALAAILLRDGHLQRAQDALKQFSQRAKKKEKQIARMHTLWSLIHLKQKTYSSAIHHLKLAMKAGNKDPKLLLLLSKAYFQLRQYDNALKTIQNAPKKIRQQHSAFLIRIQSHWRKKQPDHAYKITLEALGFFPTSKSLMRLQILLLTDLKLYQTAIELGKPYLKRKGVTVDDFFVIGEALRHGKQPKLAALLLEEGLLRFSQQPKLLVLLSRVYIDLKKPLIAAQLLERVSRQERKWLPEAAELYRRAGHYWSAFYLNAKILDQAKKIAQRMGLLLELQRFEEVAAMERRLDRLDLFKNQKLIYAIAYAFFKIQHFSRAEFWLKQISNAQLFQKAITLRRAMQTCLSTPNGCE